MFYILSFFFTLSFSLQNYDSLYEKINGLKSNEEKYSNDLNEVTSQCDEVLKELDALDSDEISGKNKPVSVVRMKEAILYIRNQIKNVDILIGLLDLLTRLFNRSELSKPIVMSTFFI